MTTAQDIVDGLMAYYNKPSQGREGEKYVCLVEARSGAGFDGNNGSCDFLAINTWRGRGLEILGHEIKVSMSDWKRELDNEVKAERFSRFCHRWWIVVPSELAAKIEHEVPTAWGLMALNDGGKVRVVGKAPLTRDPEPVPVWWWIGWLAEIDRFHKRRFPYQLDKAMKAERESMSRTISDKIESGIEVRMGKYAQIQESISKVCEVVGIDLDHVGRFGIGDWEIARLRRAWALANSNVDLAAVATQLEVTARNLRAALDEEEVA